MYKYNGKVISVYDGDTCNIIVDLGFKVSMEIKCRLYGIDTPEIRTDNEKERELALKARDYLRQLVLNKDVFICSKGKDKYGRYLIDIYLDELYVNGMLVSKGFARFYYGRVAKKPWF